MDMSSVMWDGPDLAERYDRISDLQFQCGRKLVEMMSVKKGDAVLDVGCGTGRLAIYVAEVVGAQGSVTGIEPSPHRMRIAAGKLKGPADRNVRFMIGRGEDLGAFSGNAFDHVFYSSVFHWIADKKTTLEEAYRVLKPGGNAGMNTVDRDHHFAMKQVMDDVIAKKYPEHKHIEDEMSKHLVNRTELGDLLDVAGFLDIRIDIVEEKHCYSSPKELFDFIDASSFGNFMRQVPDHVKSRMLDDVGRELEKKRTPAGIELTSKMLYATATKPR